MFQRDVAISLDYEDRVINNDSTLKLRFCFSGKYPSGCLFLSVGESSISRTSFLCMVSRGNAGIRSRGCIMTDPSLKVKNCDYRKFLHGNSERLF